MAVTDVIMGALKRYFGTESRNQLIWLLNESAKWQPKNFKPEVATRIKYLDKNMKPDLLKVLKSEFENTWEHMQRSTVTLPIVAHIVTKKATVFEGSGRFFLVDPNTRKEIDVENPEAQAFQDMINDSLVWMALNRADEITELTHSAALKVWWDNDHVTVSTFTPNLVDIVPDPDRELDPYSARAVLFQRTGVDGIRSAARHEVWGARDPTTASAVDAFGRPLFDPTIHFITDGKTSWAVNEGDVNPFKDENKRSILPYAWLTDNREGLYKLGGDNLVEINRIVNWGLTYLHHGMNWMSLGIPVFEKDPGSNVKLPQNRIISPKHALALPPNVRFSFVRNDIDLGAITNTYELFMKYHAMMSGIDPANLSVDQGQARSGFAIKLEMSGLESHRKKMIPLYKPNVIHLLNVMIIVHNYYAKAAKKSLIPTALVPDWSPGEMEAGPVDFIEIGNRYEKEIEYNISTVDDWAAEVHGVDRATAAKMVDENAKRNAEVMSKGTRFPDDVSAAAGAAGIRDLTVDADTIKTPEEEKAQNTIADLVDGGE